MHTQYTSPKFRSQKLARTHSIGMARGRIRAETKLSALLFVFQLEEEQRFQIVSDDVAVLDPTKNNYCFFFLFAPLFQEKANSIALLRTQQHRLIQKESYLPKLQQIRIVFHTKCRL